MSDSVLFRDCRLRAVRPHRSGSMVGCSLRFAIQPRSPFVQSWSRSSCMSEKVWLLEALATASRVLDEQMDQQMTTAAAAPTAPMVSALEPRSPACACNLATSPQPHHPLSRARFSVLTPATHLPGSSPARHRRLAGAAEPSVRAHAAGDRDSGPHGLRAGGTVRLALSTL